MTNSIKSKKIFIPTITGIALLAVVLVAFSPISAIADSTNPKMPQISGSVNVEKTMKDFIKDNRTTSFADAATTAEKQVTNGVAVGGNIGVVQGYLVYTFCVMDTSNDTSYIIMIDAGNGTVLHKSDGVSMKDIGKFGHGFGYGFGGHAFGGHSFGKMMPPQTGSDKTGSATPESQ
ncbi:MAG: hypothetical protein EPO62_04140 [Candidatus Nitrosotenuis sp.]|nr:MAG: hypothetical protein EPO62_04140 [Candidatus Nitrosotenuis sp.]